jgi:hypothetical protein
MIKIRRVPVISIVKAVKSKCTGKYYFQLTPQNLALMLKDHFNYCERNCSEVLGIDRNQLEDNISWYT